MKYLKLYQNFTINEELETRNTYFTKQSDMSAQVEFEIKKICDKLIDKKNIILTIKINSKEFVDLKNVVKEISKENQIIKDYLSEYTWTPKMEDDFIFNTLKKIYSENVVKTSPRTNKKIEINHLDFKLIDHVDNIETYQVIFPENIKKIILENPSTNKLDIFIYINCESDNFNRLHFPGRIERWYRNHGKRFGKDEQPQPYLGKHGKSAGDFFDGIPESLRGTGIGYAIYKEFIKFKGYLSSGSWSSSLSQGVWKKLANDKDLFGILVNYQGKDGNILLFDKNWKGDFKKISEEFIKKADSGKLYKGNDFKILNIEIDEELKRKINYEKIKIR
jgi:hypothetical protein